MAETLEKEKKVKEEIKKDSSILNFDVKPANAIPNKKYILPFGKALNGHRPMLPGCIKYITIPRNAKSGKWALNHTEEELRAYKELPIYVYNDRLRREELNEEWLKDFKVIIKDTGLTLDLDQELDLFTYRILQHPSHGIFGEIGGEALDSKRFFIKDIREEAKKSTNRSTKLFMALTKLRQMSISDIIVFSTMYKSNIRTTTAEIAEANIIQAIEKDEKELDKFLSYFETLPDGSMTVKSDTRDRLFLNLCVSYRVITNRGGAYYFRNINLGLAEKDVIKYLSTPANQQVKFQAEQELEDKIKTE